ncbi:MAG: tryptophan--tRNA ligase [Desulfoplanes sp.]
MNKEIILTGITPSGTPHLGNYAGAIRPAIENSTRDNVSCFYFLSDYHALIKNQDPQLLQQSTKEIAATWIALGLDTQKATFYRQSDIHEIPELTWILTCMTAKGLMNRAHAYKAQVAENEEKRVSDPDQGISMGLFCYPVLMSADILMFSANKIPVGSDQIQHIEMARDIAARFNYHYGELLTLPEALVGDDAAILKGLDGRKMSKSYNNTIPLFAPEKKLRKIIMKIMTDSSQPGEPKEPEGNTLFDIYRAFATKKQVEEIRTRYAEGIAWGEMKQILFECINEHLQEPRKRYEELMNNPDYIEKILQEGAEKARAISRPFLQKIREAVGLLPIR